MGEKGVRRKRIHYHHGDRGGLRLAASYRVSVPPSLASPFDACFSLYLQKLIFLYIDLSLVKCLYNSERERGGAVSRREKRVGVPGGATCPSPLRGDSFLRCDSKNAIRRC